MKELKTAARGAFIVCTTAEHNLYIVRWHDSAVVDLSSTYVCTQTVCKVKWWSKIEKTLIDVSCPAIVKEYNKYMDGTTEVENGTGEFFWSLHVAVVNGWLQYKRFIKTSEAASRSQIDLMQFTSLDISEQGICKKIQWLSVCNSKYRNQQKAGKKTRANTSSQI
ncbi:hypothetical protein T03_12577 [Trichinella britovi]|uniref:PiggyBac transposable element-derived protein 3 n=1 Tax=Trichinella britovi TaxID=45882 RepID=A0A0V1C7T7_TRIBR|nr:hypothetical protein T03_12577 [Trichinella britovi]